MELALGFLVVLFMSLPESWVVSYFEIRTFWVRGCVNQTRLYTECVWFQFIAVVWRVRMIHCVCGKSCTCVLKRAGVENGN